MLIVDQQTATLQELRQVLAELELVSQVPALDYASKNQGSVSDERSPGGKRPQGGVERKDDREHDFALKSADHFRRRLAKAHSQRTLEMILRDARRALEAWRQAPRWREGEVEPEKGTLRWKRMIADSHLPASTLARRHYISERTVHRYREAYAEKPADS